MNRRSFVRALTGALAATPFLRKFANCEVPKRAFHWFPKSGAQVWENGELISDPPKPTLWISSDKGSNWTKLGTVEEYNFTMKPIRVKADDQIVMGYFNDRT